jgi:hypothetical protein
MERDAGKTLNEIELSHLSERLEQLERIKTLQNLYF